LGKATDKGRRKEPEGQKSKVKQEESSLREKPEPDWPRRLADWRNPEGARKVDSVVDKVMIFLRKRGLGSCFLVEVNSLTAALKALW
jgi:hypothetical protein